MKKHKAYSLLEISITLFIVAILLTSGSLLFSGISRNQNIQEAQIITLERTDKIYKAILNYLVENKRLPCPARLDIMYNNVNYGMESRTGENCDENNDIFSFIGNATTQTLGVNNNMKTIYGMVPINVLNLNKQDAEDGYGHKFSYIIIKEFGTKTGISLGFESYAGSKRLGEASSFDYINIIDNSSGSDVIISNKAIMLLISHGENGAGSYNPDTGEQIMPQPLIFDEIDNFYKNTTLDLYDQNFFIDSNEINTTTSQPIIFDDFVIFKTKDQLIRDAGLEFMQCSVEQGLINSPYDIACFSSDGTITQKSYGKTSDITATLIDNDAINCGCATSGAILQRTCGKYGKWSDIFCNENYKTSILDEVRADSSNGLKLYDNFGANGIFIEDGGNIGIDNNNPLNKITVGLEPRINSLQVPSRLINENTILSLGINTTHTGILPDKIGLSMFTNTDSTNIWSPLLTFGKFNNHNGNLFQNHMAAIGSQQDSDNDNWSRGDLVFFTMDTTPSDLTEKVRIKHDGDVGIGTSNPSYKLEVNGSAAGTGDWINTSDGRYKKDILSLTNVLSKLLQLNAIYYNWKKEDFPDKNFSNKRQIGFIAQEIEKIFPKLVYTDDKGYKSISYGKITPILVQAMKELDIKYQIEIKNLKKEYNKKIDELIKRIEKLENVK